MMKKIEKKMNLFTNFYNDYYVLTEWCQKIPSFSFTEIIFYRNN